MINEGIEPSNFLNDVLEVIYFIQKKKSLGTFDSDLTISESEVEMIDQISKEVNTSTLVTFWQIILKGLDELNIVSNQLLSIEMLIIKLLHLKAMPSYEELVNKSALINNDPTTIPSKEKSVNEKTEIIKTSKEQIKSTTQTKPELISINQSKSKIENIQSFEQLIELASKKREIELKYDLERNVNLINFSQGKINIAFNENLSKDFVRNLSKKLLYWTSKRWVITLAREKGQKTFLEKKIDSKKQLLENEKEKDLYKKLKNIFPDAELVDISSED